jgi:hypothetical protein
MTATAMNSSKPDYAFIFATIAFLLAFSGLLWLFLHITVV